MAAVLLFVFYFLLLLLLLHRWQQKRGMALSAVATTAMYGYKVVMGCLYGYIFLHYYHGDDTWMYFRLSLLESQKILHQPRVFFSDFLPGPAFGASHHFWQGLQYYFQDLEYWTLIKVLGLFDLLGFNNYYIDVVFFEFIASLGILLLYGLLCAHHPSKKKMVMAVLFFLPCTTFWLSGIRAEGLLMFFLSLILYFADRWFNHRRRFRYLLGVLAGGAGCLVFRGQLLLMFAPAFFCLTLAWQVPWRATRSFVIFYGCCLLVFLGSLWAFPDNNPATPLIKRQQEFFSLHGSTRFALDSLRPTAGSFLKILPQAFANTLLRPYFWEAKGLLQWLVSLDTAIFWLFLLMALFFREKKWKEVLADPLVLLMLFYGCTQIILLGYVVPFPGALVRYKSIPEVFLLLSFALLLDEKRLLNRAKNQTEGIIVK